MKQNLGAGDGGKVPFVSQELLNRLRIAVLHTSQQQKTDTRGLGCV